MSSVPSVVKQQSRLAAAISIALAIAGLYFGYDVLMPIALSVLLAFLLAPIVLAIRTARPWER